MTEEVFEIIRAAVNLARTHSVRRLDTLRRMLLDQFPGKDSEVNEAIEYWADYAAKSQQRTLSQ